MNSLDIKSLPSIKIRPYILALSTIWSAIAIGLLVWNVIQIKQGSSHLAHIQARESLKKDILYRRWNSVHGGVYVPITEQTPANPYLKGPYRNIPVNSDLVLTLINPAYMTRQVHEMAEKEAGIIGHITSREPVRPENAPDNWEKGALETFRHGATEASTVVKC